MKMRRRHRLPNGLTEIEYATYLQIGRHWQQHGHAPSYRQLSDHFGVRLYAIVGRIDRLVRAGWIVRGPTGTAACFQMPAISVSFDDKWTPQQEASR